MKTNNILDEMELVIKSKKEMLTRETDKLNNFDLYYSVYEHVKSLAAKDGIPLDEPPYNSLFYFFNINYSTEKVQIKKTENGTLLESCDKLLEILAVLRNR